MHVFTRLSIALRRLATQSSIRSVRAERVVRQEHNGENDELMRNVIAFTQRIEERARADSA